MLLGGNDVRGGGGDDRHGRHCAPRHRPHPLCLPGPPLLTQILLILSSPSSFDTFHIYMTSHLLHVKMWTVFRPRLISQCAAGSSSASSLSSSSLDSSWQSSPSWESTLSFSTLSTAASGSSSSQSILSMILRCAAFFVFRVNMLNQFLSDDRRRKTTKRRR